MVVYDTIMVFIHEDVLVFCKIVYDYLSTNFPKIMGKTTECLLINEECIFLNSAFEEGKITHSLLVLRLPSNSL